MVKQEEDEWGVFGKMSVERYSFYGAIEAIVVSCIRDCYVEEQEQNGRGPRLQTDSQLYRFSPFISTSRKPDPITGHRFRIG